MNILNIAYQHKLTTPKNMLYIFFKFIWGGVYEVYTCRDWPPRGPPWGTRLRSRLTWSRLPL